VEIQEPSPRLLIAALRFGAVSPLLLDVRGKLIASISKESGLSEWNALPDSIQLYSTDARRFFQASIRDVYVSIENFEDLEEAKSWARDVIAGTLEGLDIGEITWMGTRMHWLSATGSFSELRDWFISRFGSVAPSAIDAIGRAPSDVGVVLEFKDVTPLITMRFGPMTAEQAMTQFFRDKDATHFPDEFLFVDVDQVHPDEHLNPRQAISTFDERVDNLAVVGGQVATAIATA
jgi:hypothetical protein